jgi:hypothetical protein
MVVRQVRKLLVVMMTCAVDATTGKRPKMLSYLPWIDAAKVQPNSLLANYHVNEDDKSFTYGPHPDLDHDLGKKSRYPSRKNPIQSLFSRTAGFVSMKLRSTW